MHTLSYFFRLARPFWFNRQRWLDWLLLTTMLAFSLLIIRMSVLISEWNKAFYDALAEFNQSVMPNLILNYLLYIVLIVAFIVIGNWLRKSLIFRWREHLTQQFQRQWLAHHYRLQFNAELDNPDQRIAEDIALLTEKSIDLFKYFMMNLAKLVAFVAILWQLSGEIHFEFIGENWTIHGYLVWITLIYSVLCTLFMHLIGHKLRSLNITQQHREADYRATLLRIQDHAEQIALYQGEKSEQHRLNHRFQQIKSNWFALIQRELKVELFSATYLRLSLFIPILATLPMYLAKTITFGDMMQARNAFSNVQDGFGWFMDYYKRLMEWSAVIKRLSEFQLHLQQLAEQKTPHIIRAEKPMVQVQDLTIFTPNGRQLFTNLSLNLTACNWVLLAGNSGIGKSTLLKTLAGIWHFYEGKITVKADNFLFLPQKPYLTDESLRAALSYPHPIMTDNDRLIRVLQQVGLPQLVTALDSIQAWHKQLSGGEQQRISLARALLHRPHLLFLDESTNQLDENTALELMLTLKAELSESLCIVISHQKTIQQLFEQRIELI